MRELLTKRVESFSKSPPPDLWIIDGGKANLDLAKSILPIDIPVIAIAKEKIEKRANRSKSKANDLIYYNNEIIRLDYNNKLLQFIQLLRDEAHRLAITSHRNRRDNI
jgi:excinuclease ABC subunit C